MEIILEKNDIYTLELQVDKFLLSLFEALREENKIKDGTVEIETNELIVLIKEKECE